MVYKYVAGLVAGVKTCISLNQINPIPGNMRSPTWKVLLSCSFLQPTTFQNLLLACVQPTKWVCHKEYTAFIGCRCGL